MLYYYSGNYDFNREQERVGLGDGEPGRGIGFLGVATVRYAGVVGSSSAGVI